MGLAVILIHVIHALTLDRMMEYKEISFHATEIPPEMNGYRIAFITDTHSMPGKRLSEVAAELNNRKVDLLVLGGDFPALDGAPRRSVEILAQIVATDGIYGVEGNHDNHRELFAAMKDHNIKPLSNSGLYVRDNFYLAGVEDLWNRSPNIAYALEGAAPGDFVLLIAHNPDITMLQETSGVSLILSGHTHGGQITFFGILAPALIPDFVTSYGHRFKSGWSLSGDGTPVYVSNGTGAYLPRVFARPQVILITLISEQGEHRNPQHALLMNFYFL